MIKNRIFAILVLFVLTPLFLSAQQEGKKWIRQGNKAFADKKYDEAEVDYRKAGETVKDPVVSDFNTGDALYKQKKYDNASSTFMDVAKNATDKGQKSDALYNLGNTLLQSGKIDESIDAYKNALRLNPDDMDAKYNLSYALRLKKQQQQQQQQQNKNKQQNKDQQQQQQQNQDQNKQQQQQQQQNQDQQQQNKQNQQQDQNQQQNNNQQQQQNKNQDQQQQQQNNKQGQQQQKQSESQQQNQQPPREGEISRQAAERLLQALANDEKKVQEKVKKAKAKQQKTTTVINW